MTPSGIDLSRANWRTSSHSGGNGGQCVEVARNLPGVVVVRDSKARQEGTLVRWGRRDASACEGRLHRHPHAATARSVTHRQA